ncbi:MAG: hypothetical protein ACOCXH_03030 [Cyclobacteriaceae bacterium]
MKAYIYPNSKKGGFNNPYLHNFVQSFGNKINFINYDHASKRGIIDIFFYLPGIELLFINWIEDITEKKGGKIQWLLFKYLIVPFCRFLNIKIVWTLHNRISHYQSQISRKKRIFDYMVVNSDFIITHAKEGVSLIREHKLKVSGQVIFFPHPMNPRNRFSHDEKDIDIFIWGSIAPYKGIDQFIDLVKSDDIFSGLKIILAGKAKDTGYEKEIQGKLPPQIKYINRYLDDNELDDFLSRSRITLFPYASDSILSSGALSDSIGYGTCIIGPSKGAFIDLEEEGLVQTFNNLNELPLLCKKVFRGQGMNIQPKNASGYISRYSWKAFAREVYNSMNEVNVKT